MAFKSRAELNGAVDPRINMQGPNINGKPKTRREQYSSELLTLLRKLKPHQSAAVAAAMKVMQNQEANDANVLRASALILQTYRDLLRDMYNGVDLEEPAGEDIQGKGPVFSLKMINGDKQD